MASIPVLSSYLSSTSLRNSHFSSSNPNQLPCTLALSALFGTKISIQFSNSRRFAPKKYCRATSATVSSSLPTTKHQTVAPEKLPKWSARAIKAFGLAELEARKLKYPNTGTETLLMGILVEGTSKAAKFLRANGITLFKVQEETIELLGKSDMYFYSPEHPPLTEQAQRAFDWAVDEKVKSGEEGEITVTHLLLGIWNQQDSAGHKIMASFGFNDEKAKELAQLMDRDVDFGLKKQVESSNDG
ncbi:hypothetical protein L6164_006182 [Bauhinia variegata]|uniref:Uncharacterized protein n=1 Tax=Bauhinia variegata TaxID=167791 RepID=A0ACB9PTR0_BAUVA|nr:hypothetical protein L6164_006182 [Bauhinia variegata]